MRTVHRFFRSPFLEISLLAVFAVSSAFSAASCCNSSFMSVCWKIVESPGSVCDCDTDCPNNTAISSTSGYYTIYPPNAPYPKELKYDFPTAPYDGYEWCFTGAFRVPTMWQVQYAKRCCDNTPICLMGSYTEWFLPPPCYGYYRPYRVPVRMYCVVKFPGSCS